MTWTAVAVAAVSTVVGITRPRSGTTTALPKRVYGVEVSFAGGQGACVAAAFNTATRRWVCTSIEQNVDLSAPAIVRPGPYPRSCTEIEADQTAGRWRCGNTEPVDPSTLPDGPSVG
jgi:hypothetical protein